VPGMPVRWARPGLVGRWPGPRVVTERPGRRSDGGRPALPVPLSVFIATGTAGAVVVVVVAVANHYWWVAGAALAGMGVNTALVVRGRRAGFRPTAARTGDLTGRVLQPPADRGPSDWRPWWNPDGRTWTGGLNVPGPLGRVGTRGLLPQAVLRIDDGRVTLRFWPRGPLGRLGGGLIQPAEFRATEGVAAFPVRVRPWVTPGVKGVGFQRGGEPEHYFWCSAREIPVILAALVSEGFQVSWSERRAHLLW
jgi:hypothetical protein